MKFVPNDDVRRVAEAYALDACDFVHTHFQVTLDWSDASVQRVEQVLDVFHRGIATAKPSEAQLAGIAQMFGSYIGEVYRKNHGASWGILELNGEQMPGLKATASETMFWPWGRVQNRLVDGAENNVWHYYSALIR